MRKEQKANYPESARGAAALLVRMVLEDGAYTNIALNQYLRGSRLSDLDRRLATELVYGTVKASGTLDWYLAQCVSRPLDKVAGDILAILRISTYQLLYMTRIPASAAVNEAVKLARKAGCRLSVTEILPSALAGEALAGTMGTRRHRTSAGV